MPSFVSQIWFSVICILAVISSTCIFWKLQSWTKSNLTKNLYSNLYSKFLWILILLMSSPAFLQVIHRSFPIKYIVQVPVILYTLRDWYYLTQHRFSLMSSVFPFRLDMVTSQLFFFMLSCILGCIYLGSTSLLLESSILPCLFPTVPSCLAIYY